MSGQFIVASIAFKEWEVLPNGGTAIGLSLPRPPSVGRIRAARNWWVSTPQWPRLKTVGVNGNLRATRRHPAVLLRLLSLSQPKVVDTRPPVGDKSDIQ